ncbi:unnamed protein product [Gadus morhua 'NCC']
MRCAIHRAIVWTTSTADCRAIRYSQSSTITRLQSALHGSNSVVHCYSHSTQNRLKTDWLEERVETRDTLGQSRGRQLKRNPNDLKRNPNDLKRNPNDLKRKPKPS